MSVTFSHPLSLLRHARARHVVDRFNWTIYFSEFFRFFFFIFYFFIYRSAVRNQTLAVRRHRRSDRVNVFVRTCFPQKKMYIYVPFTTCAFIVLYYSACTRRAPFNRSYNIIL